MSDQRQREFQMPDVTNLAEPEPPDGAFRSCSAERS